MVERPNLSYYYSFFVKISFLFCFALALVGVVDCRYNPTWWSSVAQLAAHHNQHASKLILVPPSQLPHLIPKPSKAACLKLAGLSPGQARVCELFPDHMTSVGSGAKQAIDECQFQFRGRRWNCSTPYESGVLGPVHEAGTKEAAFTYGLVAGAVMWEVSRGCRQGLLNTCGCNQESRPENLDKEFLWGGCGDNVHYGYQFAQNFIDVRERERQISPNDADYGRSLMNRWNNEVGRKTVRRLSRIMCKCHGVSGSCNLKTCWRQLPALREVGEFLASRYDEAVRVKISRRGNLKMLRGGRKRRAAQVDLVYLDESPDYCRTDKYSGVIGTEGRACNRTPASPHDPGSCEGLCCGRGYNTLKHISVKQCDCKFLWCCKVQCRTCQTREELNTCK